MKKIHCDVIRDLLPLYADNAASIPTWALVQEHLKTCPQCREELEMMRSLVTLPPDEDAGLVLENFRAKKARRRRQKKFGVLCTLMAAVLLVVYCLWYTRPMTLEELYPDFDWAACYKIEIQATYKTNSLSKDQDYRVTLTPDDPDFQRILSLFQYQTYQRSLFGPENRSGKVLLEGDFSWYIVLRTDTRLTYSNGDTLNGDALILDNFYGKMDIREAFTEKTYRCTTPDFDQWASEVMKIIRTYSYTTY